MKTFKTPEELIDSLPEDRMKAITQLRKVINKNLPKGFDEGIGSGMLSYFVPHKIYPDGYHVNPKQPLTLMMVGSQKSHIVIHHLGLYANKKLTDWFITEYQKATGTKPDMGKGCVRFKKPESIPFELIGTLVAKVTVADWIAEYEKHFTKK